jgi:predicted ATPase
VLEAVADEQALVVWVDDAPWLDRASLLALGRAARDLPRSPVLFLCTATPHQARVELNELRARIGRELAGAAVQVGPLSTDAVRTLGRWAVPSYDAVQLDRLTRRVTTDSAGIPLLVVALLEAVAAGLDLQNVRGAWPEPLRTLDQTPPDELPDAVIAAIRVLFGKLSADARRVLVTAAVLGLRVPASVLGRASGLATEALAAALDELEWQRLLSSEPRGYAFVARIVRDVIDRDMVTPGQRERIRAAARAAAPPG